MSSLAEASGKLKLKPVLKGQMQLQLNTHLNESQNRNQNGNGNQNSNILLIANPGRTRCQETGLSLEPDSERETEREGAFCKVSKVLEARCI